MFSVKERAALEYCEALTVFNQERFATAHDELRTHFTERGIEPTGIYYEKFALAAAPDTTAPDTTDGTDTTDDAADGATVPAPSGRAPPAPTGP